VDKVKRLFRQKLYVAVSKASIVTSVGVHKHGGVIGTQRLKLLYAHQRTPVKRDDLIGLLKRTVSEVKRTK
jgi:hypothetical protein